LLLQAVLARTSICAVLHYLSHLNPGTHYDVDVDIETQAFKACALVKGDLENEILRPIFGLDVAHMKLLS
jgi:hypothetical protein